MIALLLAIALTDSQQAIHDDMERKMRAELVSAREVIELWWRPSKRVLRDYDNAEKCYSKFHLYKVKGCDAKLDALHRDLNPKYVVEGLGDNGGGWGVVLSPEEQQKK